MPPQTRARKTLKTLKEDISVRNKTKPKPNAKAHRKPLADKTNSASDDNASMLSPKRHKERVVTLCKQKQISQDNRPRRERRLPSRYVENDLLKNLSNNESLSPQKLQSTKKITTGNHDLQQSPKQIITTNKAKIRPSKKVANVLKKDDNHKNHQMAISTRKSLSKIDSSKLVNDNKDIITSKAVNVQSKLQKREANNNKTKTNDCLKLNVKHQNVFKGTPKKLPNKVFTKSNISDINKVLVNTSIRLLENKRRSLKRDSTKLDVYEFTFDPNEEPPPQKKKKRKPVKNPSKSKRVVKSNYEKNLARVLASLKNTVMSKPKEVNIEKKNITESVYTKNIIKETILPTENKNRNISEISENKYNSIRVEDIALQFQEDGNIDDQHIDYSPINSPCNALPSPIHSNLGDGCVKTPVRNKDPLNLHNNLSFFDERPLANSSMNNSIRDPLASPWRVEFNNLPIKWQVNSYVKPNMTPALDTSYINFNNNKKKHVYTNICVDTNEPPLPAIVESTPNLKQTSIISFIREVVEKSANRKKKHKVVQNNSLFNEGVNVEHPKENSSPELPIQTSSSSNDNIQSDKENTQPQAENSIHSDELKKTECIKDKNITYFGFDDSENQENVTPIKKTRRIKPTKQRSRVLQELNCEINNRRQLVIPLAAKSNPVKNISNVNKVFDEVKSAMEPPAFPDVHVDKNIEDTNINDDLIENNIDNDDSHPVHLFEDIEFVHHTKPTRKSYSKAKKVIFRHKSATINNDSDNESTYTSDEDNLEDLSFKLPSFKQKKIKKKSKKNQKTKKEEKEVEAWAAEFNSMCENVEEFDLVVE